MQNQLEFAQKAFIVHDNTVLMVRKSMDDPHNPGKWEVPGGRLQWDEPLVEHLPREVYEEVGINIEPREIFYLWDWYLKPKSEGDINRRIVAVARICVPSSFDVSMENQVDDDFISNWKWIPFHDLRGIEIIPNMSPVVSAFLNRVQA